MVEEEGCKGPCESRVMKDRRHYHQGREKGVHVILEDLSSRPTEGKGVKGRVFPGSRVQTPSCRD